MANDKKKHDAKNKKTMKEKEGKKEAGIIGKGKGGRNEGEKS